MDTDSATRIKAVEELLSKLTAANESLTQDRDREQKKAKLLEQELLSLRKSTEELRKALGAGGADDRSFEVEALEVVVRDLKGENRELREKVAKVGELPLRRCREGVFGGRQWATCIVVMGRLFPAHCGSSL